MSKSPALKTAARRRQLIDATITAIGRRGYANTTLTHVAGEAGLSPGIVNFYFKTKEQLLQATLEQITDEYATSLREALDKAGPSPAAQLDAMIDADFDPRVFTLEKVAVWYAFWAEAHSQPSYRTLVSRMEAEYYDETTALCRQLIEAGGYDGLDPGAVAGGLNAMIDGFWFDFLIDPRDFDREDAKRTCRLFLAGLFPREFRPRLEPSNAPSAGLAAPARGDAMPVDGLPADAYTDPAMLAREAAQLFPRSWQFVCHESELPASGDYVTFDLLRDGAFVLRGEDGALRGFLNVCRHRAARLLDGAAASGQGNCGHAVTCPYHGWTYDFLGHLKAVPAERSFAKIDWQGHGLLPLEIDLFEGFVFTRLAGRGPSVATLLAPYGDDFAAYRLPEMMRLEAVESERLAVNWKVAIDDFRQGYEIALAHPGLARLFGGAYATDVAANGVARAVGRLRDRPAGGWAERLYRSLLPEIAHLPAELAGTWRFYSLFPNTCITLQPDQAIVLQVLPLAAEESLIRTRCYGLPQADRRLNAARYLARRINRGVAGENAEIFRRVQRGLASGHAPCGPIADSEIAVRQFHAKLRNLLATNEPAADGRATTSP